MSFTFTHLTDSFSDSCCRTGFYEADGFFDHSAAPWLHVAQPRESAQSGTPSTQKISGRAAAVFESMQNADRDAVWVYQGWPWKGLSVTPAGKTFMQSFTAAVPNGRLVILDLEAESYEVWRRSESFYGASFVWCAMVSPHTHTRSIGDDDDVTDESLIDHM